MDQPSPGDLAPPGLRGLPLCRYCANRAAKLNDPWCDQCLGTLTLMNRARTRVILEDRSEVR